MKKVLSFIPLCFLVHSLSGQIGFAGAYSNLKANKWYGAIAKNTGQNFDSSDGYSIGLDYWFRLKKKRIEFTPEVNFSSVSSGTNSIEISHRVLGFYFNTNFYFLDFKNDCDCPVWSKTGNFFTKGFFVQISPGVLFMKNKFKNEALSKDNDLTVGIGAGAGLDIGVSDLLTVTPTVKYSYVPSATWEHLPVGPATSQDIGSKANQLNLGIRIGWRLNTTKKRF